MVISPGHTAAELRKPCVRSVGDLVRQEPQRLPGQAGVWPVTGLLPSPVEAPATPRSPSPPPAVSPPASTPATEAVLTQLIGHTRYLLTRKGRPPFCLAGLETYERLSSVAGLSLDVLATRHDTRLAQLYQGLQAALAPFARPMTPCMKMLPGSVTSPTP